MLIGSGQSVQGTNIFKTKCLIQGKVCSLFIDLRASHNLVSKEVINKLHLKNFPHPNPYYATWVSKDQNLLVNEKVILNFSIGQYADSILCDVMEMSCGHVILGRPWQWSMRTVHDGYTNTYIVHKGKVRYKLTPFIESGIQTMIMCFGNNILIHG